LNGLTSHVQVAENGRMEAKETSMPHIRFYTCAHETLKTPYTNH
jgi:hypothetical protein